MLKCSMKMYKNFFGQNKIPDRKYLQCLLLKIRIKNKKKFFDANKSLLKKNWKTIKKKFF